MSVYISRRLLTIQNYHDMAKAGILVPEDRVELINGEIINMSPIGSKHAACVNRLSFMFYEVVGKRAWVSIQNPLSIAPHSEPEPDILLLRPDPNEYMDQHPVPSDVLLLIEVADSTWEYDKEIKLPLYAKSFIPVVWLINLNKSEIEVHQDPEDGIYQQKNIYNMDQRVSLPGFEKEMSVREILGK